MLRKLRYYLYPVTRLGLATYFVIALLLSASAISALRQNNLRMLELRQAVIDADEAGESIDSIRPKVAELGNHVLNHMNTSMSDALELVNTYTRANEQQRRAAYENLVPTDVYTQAESACQAANAVQRAICITTYISDNFSGSNFETPEDLPAADYRFDFVSPVWSADLAGWSLLLALFSWVVVVYEFLTHRLARMYMNRANSGR